MTPTNEIQAMKERLAKATKRPWKQSNYRPNRVIQRDANEGTYTKGDDKFKEIAHCKNVYDADFIVHAPGDICLLLSHIESREREIERLKVYLDRAGWGPCNFPACNCNRWHLLRPFEQEWKQASELDSLRRDGERLDKFNFLAIDHVIKFTRFENGLLDLALAKESAEALAYHGNGSIRDAIDSIDVAAIAQERKGEK